MSTSGTGRQRHLKRPHCFMCENHVLSASSSSSAASTQQRQRQRQRQRRSVTIHEPTTTSVPPRTSTISSSAQASARSSSTSSRSAASLPSHASSSIQQQRHSATVLVPTPSPPSSSATTPPGSMPSTPSTLPSSTMTPAAAAAVAGSSMSSSLSILLARASVPSMPPLLAQSSATPANVPLEPSFRDPDLAERYWKYDHQKVSLSDAVAAELAFLAAPAFVKRVLGRWEKPPWFWGQKKSVAWLTFITREDIEEKSVCAICMEEYRQLQPCYIILRCFHFFHKYCFLEWGLHCLVQGKEVSCPLCRSTIPISPLSLLHAA